jgi:hypothetical protein
MEFSPFRRRYRPNRGRAIPHAVNRLVNAEVIVSYNGNHRDLLDLAQLAGVPAGRRIEIRGEHIDMREICWSKDIWGSDLVSAHTSCTSRGFPGRGYLWGYNRRDVLLAHCFALSAFS